MGQHSVFTQAQEQAKSYVSKGESSVEDGRALLQNAKGLRCDSPTGASGAQTASRPDTVRASELSSRTQPPAPVTEPSLTPGLAQDEQLFRSLGKWTRVTHQNEK